MDIFLQDGLLLIFPRPDSKFATARVRLPHHGLHPADEETGLKFSFKLTRRSKVTLYMKVGPTSVFSFARMCGLSSSSAFASSAKGAGCCFCHWWQIL